MSVMVYFYRAGATFVPSARRTTMREYPRRCDR
jgi:hypothetical protein